MSRKKVSITDATVADLRAFATEVMMLDVPATANRAQLIAKLAPVWQHDFITVAETPEVQPAQEPAAPPVEEPTSEIPDPPTQMQPRRGLDIDSSKDRRKKILIHQTPEKGGSRPVPVGVNGRTMYLPRGQDIVIPERYVEVLKNAVKTTYTMDEVTHDIMAAQANSYPFEDKGFTQDPLTKPEDLKPGTVIAA